jgi:hypothetical protein
MQEAVSPESFSERETDAAPEQPELALDGESMSISSDVSIKHRVRVRQVDVTAVAGTR